MISTTTNLGASTPYSALPRVPMERGSSFHSLSFMARRLFLLLALSSLVCVSVAQSNSVLAANGLRMLNLKGAPGLFRQCSRDAPRPGRPIWIPTSDQIAELESRLPQFITAKAASQRMAPNPGGNYARQYAGFTNGGKRYIYGSFFPEEWLELHQDPGAIIICDGGPNVWGVVYDSGRKTFGQLRMNGYL